MRWKKYCYIFEHVITSICIVNMVEPQADFYQIVIVSVLMDTQVLFVEFIQVSFMLLKTQESIIPQNVEKYRTDCELCKKTSYLYFSTCFLLLVIFDNIKKHLLTIKSKKKNRQHFRQNFSSKNLKSSQKPSFAKKKIQKVNLSQKTH